MHRNLVLAILVPLVVSGCFASENTGSHTMDLSVGLHEVAEQRLTSGDWDWEITHAHDGLRTTGEIQFFLDEATGPRLIETASIREPQGGFGGLLQIDGTRDVRILLEVYTTDGGHIEVAWSFSRR